MAWLCKETYALDRVMFQDLNDPRCKKGPCKHHAEAWTLEELLRTDRTTMIEEEEAEISGNMYGSWIDCSRCALRLVYIPKKTYHGKYKLQTNPRLVQLTLDLAQSRKIWDNMDAQVWKALYQAVEAEETIKEWLEKNKDVKKDEKKVSERKTQLSQARRAAQAKQKAAAKSRARGSAETPPAEEEETPCPQTFNIHQQDESDSFEVLSQMSVTTETPPATTASRMGRLNRATRE